MRIRTSSVEIAPKRTVTLTTYNGQFPGPLLRLKERKQATIDVYNETDVQEQLHWHRLKVPVDVDGAAEGNEYCGGLSGKRNRGWNESSPGVDRLAFHPGVTPEVLIPAAEARIAG